MNSIAIEMKPIFNRLRSIIFDGYINANAIRGDHDPIKILDPLVQGDFPETLYFPDIDYTDDCRSLWDVERHYGRIEQALLADKGI
ncbi:MAG: hypothetical protein E7481_03430 [Ruminococcaceae bacterium]|nr:hypothetical protein [Oscillospiraceae bacterium]